MHEALKKKALLLALVDPSGNPRPKRAISLLQQNGFEVHVASFDFKADLKVDAHYKISFPNMKLHMRILRKLASLFTSVFQFQFLQAWQENLRWNLSGLEENLLLESFDLMLVEDLYLLPLAIRIKRRAKIIFDAREFYPRQYEHNLLWSITERFQRIRMCRQDFPFCDGFITVSDGLAKEYKKEFSINPIVVRSTPTYQDVPVKPVNEKNIRVVHHGVANRNRRIENMINIIDHLDNRYSIDFYLVGNQPYVAELKKLADKNPRIRFCDPVAFDKIIPMLNEYDIGLSFLEPTTFNLKHCLPNKLFEFIQARLMVATGPSPDMAEIVTNYNIGIVSENFYPQTMASMLNALTPSEIYSFKQKSAEAARALSFEEESKKFIKLISELV